MTSSAPASFRRAGLLLPRGRREDARSREQRDLERGPADAASAAVDQNGLAPAGRPPRADDHPPGRLVDEGKGRRLLEGEAAPGSERRCARARRPSRRRCPARARRRSGTSDAEALLAPAAELAGVAVETGLEEHPVARARGPRLRRPTASTTPGAVGARDLRQRHVRESRCERRCPGGSARPRGSRRAPRRGRAPGVGQSPYSRTSLPPCFRKKTAFMVT